ncbi:MAG: helix-turn-helix transcriptional regulator [Clostridiales bacterium]|nr:helix-turn-helix transcriptional regulator [Clostridiales bacterium]
MVLNTDKFYSNIEAERARKGWTIKETADRLGIGEKTYRERLAQGKDVSASALIQYATVFGVSTDYLLGLSDKLTIA